MPPLSNSRYLNVAQLTDDEGRIYLDERTPFDFIDLPDNRFHTVVQGDTLWALAERAWPNLPDAATYWWVICEFQPDPILDPTLALIPDQVLVIPSARTIAERIQNPSREQ